MTWPPQISLTDGNVSLVPLSHDHRDDLAEASADGALHRLWYTTAPSPEGMKEEIDRRLSEERAGRMRPFSVFRNEQAVGMTTFMNIDGANRRLEIGSTWYRAAVQRTGLNTSCKRLLLGHAFEALECIAVEFRTHCMNRQSRVAIERLGAKLDGVLRSHMIMANGTLRDTAVYSVTACDWPAVRANLDAFIAARS
jgi:RimJ/RimL family protein N-acetyltransferase